MSGCAAASMLVISPSVALTVLPALPSKTQGPTLFRGVIGPSLPPGGDGVRLSPSWFDLRAPETVLIGNGSEMAWLTSFLWGVSGVMLTVTSICSLSTVFDRSGVDVPEPATGAAGSGSGSGSGSSSVSGSVSTCAGVEASASASFFICCHSSASSSTSASKSAPARQLGQMKIGYWGELSSDLTHLKCHVCEQGATNKDWQGYE